LPQHKKQIALCLCQLAIQRSIFLHVSVDAVVDVWLQSLSSETKGILDDDFQRLQDPMSQQDLVLEIRKTVQQLEEIFTDRYPSMPSFWNALDRNVAQTFRSALS